MTTPTIEKMTPETLQAMAHAIESRPKERGPFPVGELTVQWLRECAASWASALEQLGASAELLFQAGCCFALEEDFTPARKMFQHAKRLGHKDADEQLAALPPAPEVKP